MFVVNWFVSWLLAKRYEWVATEERVECGDGAYRRGPAMAEGRRRVPIDGLTNGRRERIARRVALLVIALGLVIGGVWYLVTGSVPATTAMSVPFVGSVTSPFALSHVLYAPLVGVWTYVLLSTIGLQFHWRQLIIALPVLAISALLTWVLFLPILAGVILVAVGLLSLYNFTACRSMCRNNLCAVAHTGRALRYGVYGSLMLLPGIGLMVMLPVGLIVAGYRLNHSRQIGEDEI